MKTTFFLFCILLASLAWGQSAVGVSVLSGQPQPLHQTSHPEHASQASRAGQRSLLGTGGYAYAKGERPLWEVAPPPIQQPSLGDAARAARKEREAAKKATFVREN